MKGMKFAATAAALVFMSGAAQSADLFTPEPAPVYGGGWYVGIFGGANWLDDTSFDIEPDPIGELNVDNSYDTGFVVGGNIGYNFGEAMGPVGVRLEAELSYRDNKVKNHSIGPAVQPLPTGNTTALAGMGNILLELNTGTPFSIYGGGGIGAAKVELDGHGANNTVLMNDSDTVFAWQAIGGVGYEVAPGWVLDVQYRYFNANSVSLTATNGSASETDYKSHSVLGGIRFNF